VRLRAIASWLIVDIGGSDVRVLPEDPGTVPASADGRGFALFGLRPLARPVGSPAGVERSSTTKAQVADLGLRAEVGGGGRI
jgi:hypothetical protein